MGQLEQIWIKRARRGEMEPVDRVTLTAGRGIDGNVDLGGRRQVTIVGREGWERATGSLGADVDPAARRANLLVSGVDLKESAERILSIGSARILINGETRPCGRMDDAHEGLMDALDADWLAGAYGAVLDGGEIAVGDPVSLDGSNG